MSDDTERLVKNFNSILSDPNPVRRIRLITSLSEGVLGVLSVPTIALEQLITTIQSEHDLIAKSGVEGLSKEIVEGGLSGARLAMGVIRAFQKHRREVHADIKPLTDIEFPE